MKAESQQPKTGLELAIQKQLQLSPLPEYDGYLLEKILDRLGYQERLAALRPKLWTAFSLSAASLVLLLWAVFVSVHAYAQTPIGHYLALIFSDFKTVADNWQDFSFSILETLPLGASAFLLSAILASVLLFDFSIHQFSRLRKLNNHDYGHAHK